MSTTPVPHGDGPHAARQPADETAFAARFGGAEPSSPIAALVRELHLYSTHNALFSDAVAQRLGINSTDMECVDLLHLFGAMTPSRLAELTGLTTGAITRLVDRLERGGWVRRVPDLQDRRRVTIEPLHGTRTSPAWEHFKGMATRMAMLISQYDAAQLELLTEFTRRSNEILRDEAARMRRADASDALDASSRGG